MHKGAKKEKLYRCTITTCACDRTMEAREALKKSVCVATRKKKKKSRTSSMVMIVFFFTFFFTLFAWRIRDYCNPDPFPPWKGKISPWRGGLEEGMIDSCCCASVRLFPHYTILGFLPGFLRSSGGCTSAPAHAARLRAVRSAVPPSFF